VGFLWAQPEAANAATASLDCGMGRHPQGRVVRQICVPDAKVGTIVMRSGACVCPGPIRIHFLRSTKPHLDRYFQMTHTDPVDFNLYILQICRNDTPSSMWAQIFRLRAVFSGVFIILSHPTS
jgi:hypothetical protein